MRLTEKKTKTVYLPDDPDGASVTIKYLKPGIRESIESQSNDISATGSGGDMETVVKFNLPKKRRLFLEAVIDGWAGFFDKKDRPLSVSPRNIGRVDEEIDNFYSWLQAESDMFIEEVEELEEESIKN